MWMVKLSMMERVTHFAEAEQDWLFLTVRRAAANGAVDLHGHPLLSSRDHAEAEALADGRVRAVKVAS
jgi:3',5'-cyclic AMP phosphodiesterase CpdA